MTSRSRPDSPQSLIDIKRAYEPAVRTDGYRILVDRLWPRGVKKEQIHIDAWHKELAPSDALRRWFAHDPRRWNAFVGRYQEELRTVEACALLDNLAHRAAEERLTLVYGARDEEHNHALVLRDEIGRRSRWARRASAGKR